jgi:excisionase family DNA binding protein
MYVHTLTSAARATGIAKSTIRRAIKAGRLPAHKLETGNYAIDLAELHRVFPSVLRVARGARANEHKGLGFPNWDVG